MLFEFYKYPAEHWIHLRTANQIEPTCATVRWRTKVTKEPGCRVAGIALRYKLIDAAPARWRAVDAPHLVALVRDCARSSSGASRRFRVSGAPRWMLRSWNILQKIDEVAAQLRGGH